MEEKALVKQVELSLEDVKKFVAKGATEQELFLFMGIAKSYGLNPFKREIHFIKYGEKAASIVVGYEVYLKKAEATGKLNGWKCWIEDGGDRAVIEIRRKDWEEPFRWEVNRKEFDTHQANWARMPAFMLKKVCIGQGFRLAFPEDLGGLPYLPEEINGGTSEELKKEEVQEEAVHTEALHEAPLPQEEPEKKGITVQIESVMERVSQKNKKKYFEITTKDGAMSWTYDSGLADLARDAQKIDADMVMYMGPKGRIEMLEVAK